MPPIVSSGSPFPDSVRGAEMTLLPTTLLLCFVAVALWFLGADIDD